MVAWGAIASLIGAGASLIGSLKSGGGDDTSETTTRSPYPRGADEQLIWDDFIDQVYGTSVDTTTTTTPTGGQDPSGFSGDVTIQEIDQRFPNLRFAEQERILKTINATTNFFKDAGKEPLPWQIAARIEDDLMKYGQEGGSELYKNRNDFSEQIYDMTLRQFGYGLPVDEYQPVATPTDGGEVTPLSSSLFDRMGEDQAAQQDILEWLIGDVLGPGGVSPAPTGGGGIVSAPGAAPITTPMSINDIATKWLADKSKEGGFGYLNKITERMQEAADVYGTSTKAAERFLQPVSIGLGGGTRRQMIPGGATKSYGSLANAAQQQLAAAAGRYAPGMEVFKAAERGMGRETTEKSRIDLIRAKDEAEKSRRYSTSAQAASAAARTAVQARQVENQRRMAEFDRLLPLVPEFLPGAAQTKYMEFILPIAMQLESQRYGIPSTIETAQLSPSWTDSIGTALKIYTGLQNIDWGGNETAQFETLPDTPDFSVNW